MSRSHFYKKLENWIRDSFPKDLNMCHPAVLEKLREDYSGLEDAVIRRWFMLAWDSTTLWSGLLPKETSNPDFLYTIIAKSNNEPFVVRGYPTSKKINNLSFNHKMVMQPSYDGIICGFFLTFDGKLKGTNRLLEYMDRDTISNRDYMKIFEQTGLRPKIEALLNDHKDLVVWGELYGHHESLAGYIDYEDEVAFKVFDICDRSNHEFLSWKESLSILEQYDIPTVETITEEEINETLQKHEGVVFKHYDNGEIHLYKKLSEQVKAWMTEPDEFGTKRLRVAIRKAIEES